MSKELVLQQSLEIERQNKEIEELTKRIKNVKDSDFHYGGRTMLSDDAIEFGGRELNDFQVQERTFKSKIRKLCNNCEIL